MAGPVCCLGSQATRSEGSGVGLRISEDRCLEDQWAGLRRVLSVNSESSTGRGVGEPELRRLLHGTAGAEGGEEA